MGDFTRNIIQAWQRLHRWAVLVIGTRWRSSTLVTWHLRPVRFVVVSEGGWVVFLGGYGRGTYLGCRVAMGSGRRWRRSQSTVGVVVMVVGEKEVTCHGSHRFPDLGQRGPPDRTWAYQALICMNINAFVAQLALALLRICQPLGSIHAWCIFIFPLLY